MKRERRILITAALPYANGKYHLGHARSTYLPADIFARFQKLNKADVAYICATDEHGTPILLNAEKDRKKPEEYVKYWHNYFDKLFKEFGLIYDIFYRTHSKENKKLTIEFFNKAKKNGYIYEQEIEQYYCEKDKKFLPDRYVTGKCPYCNAEDQYSDYCEDCGKAFMSGEILNPKCRLCKAKPVMRKSMHYFFTLNALKKEISNYLQFNEYLQKDVKNYVKQWIKQGLKDWDITRNLEWGFKVPGKKEQVFYVWWDAPIGYISSTIKWAKQTKKNWEDYWKSKKTEIYHFIGKDIVYHHYLFWPAMLMSVKDKYTLPKMIPTRGYLNLEGRKFSKSRNWSITLEDFFKVFPADYLRFYLTMITPQASSDANFSLNEFKKRINDDLIANFGNLSRRALYFIEKFFDKKVPKPTELDAKDKGVITDVKKQHEKITKLLEEVRLMKALQEVLKCSSIINTYFQEKEPWKTKNPNCLYVTLNLIKGLCIELSPFIPFSTNELWKSIGLKGKAEEQDWSKAFELSIKAGHEIKSSKPLYKLVSDEEIKKLKRVLGKNLELKEELVELKNFKKIKLRIGSIQRAERINDKLLKLKVLADRERIMIAGIGEQYNPKELLGKKVVVIINLKPKVIAGIKSEGMVLAAEKKGRIVLLTTMKDITENAVVL